jgi:hypothetical protein
MISVYDQATIQVSKVKQKRAFQGIKWLRLRMNKYLIKTAIERFLF